jgi:hypothetical protein
MKKINLTDYIRKSATQVSLSDSERERMKRVLSEYVAMKPMRNAPLARRAPLSYMFMSVYAFSRKSVAALLIAGILFSGAGVSFAAENALPGDALYSLKVDVNEPIVAALSVSSESKALWNAERAERRLEEAAKLASDDRLTDTLKEELEQQFDAHVENVVTDIERLETTNSPVAADIAAQLEYKLLAHEVVLKDVAHSDKVQKLKERVKTKAARLATVGNRARGGYDAATTVALAQAPTSESVAAFAPEASTMTMTVAVDTEAGVQSPEPARMKSRAMTQTDEAPHVVLEPAVKEDVVKRFAQSAEKEFKNASKMYDRVKQRLDTEAAARIQVQLTQVGSLLSSGAEAMSQGNLDSAFNSYREASGTSAKLTVFLKAFQKLRLVEIPDEQNAGRAIEEKDNDSGNDSNEGKSEIEIGGFRLD